MIDIGHKGNCTIHRGWDCSCGQQDRIDLATEQTMHAAWRKRAEEAEAELAAMTLERDSYMLLSKMRPAPMADMVPAEELAKVKAERDAAFEMSRCECGTDEACANLARLHRERDAAVADAERYRWLRDVAWSRGDAILYTERYGPEDWDAAIDAARKGERK